MNTILAATPVAVCSKLHTVLFGERLNPAVMGHAVAIASATPLLLAVGTSLVVEPAAELCRVAVNAGAHLVIINRDPTPYDELATDVLRADITQTVPTLVDQLIRARAQHHSTI